MKKLLAVFLAVVMIVFSLPVAFAATYISPSGFLLRFSAGNGKYNIPIDFTSYSSLKSYFLNPSNQLIFVFHYNNGAFTDSVTLYACHSSSFKFATDTVKSYFSSNLGYKIPLKFDSERCCLTFGGLSSSFGSNTLQVIGGTSYPTFCPYIPGRSVSYHKDCKVLSGANISILEYVPPAPKENTLTVNYKYSNGTSAADPVTQSLAPGTEYSIPSPEIAGYTPDIPLVTGTMPEEDLTVTVTYAKAFYPLTVQYQYTDGSQAAESVSFQYPLGFVYDIPSPEIEGYQPDKPTIAGEMPGEALEEVVTYSAIPYTLTVQYLFTDGSQAAPDHQEQLTIGSSYSVPSPVIEGYHPNQTAVTGIMPASDVVSTVTYREDSGGSSGPGSSGPGEGGGSGGDGGDSSGGSSGDDPFIPVLPPSSGNDPFIVPQPPPYSGPDPFLVPEPPPYSGHDPFIVRQPPPWSGYDPFAIPDDLGG